MGRIGEGTISEKKSGGKFSSITDFQGEKFNESFNTAPSEDRLRVTAMFALSGESEIVFFIITFFFGGDLFALVGKRFLSGNRGTGQIFGGRRLGVGRRRSGFGLRRYKKRRIENLAHFVDSIFESLSA